MCGRFTLTAGLEELIDRFDIKTYQSDEEYHPSYNVAPSQLVLAVVNDGKMNRMGYLKWGLIPTWATDPKIGYKMINARAETISEKRSFRNLLFRKRCLIIADSFYEWKKDKNNIKTPMRIQLKDNALFAMAGLWEHWKAPSGGSIYSCTVITTEANELVNNIHDRMPVILKRKDEKAWLDPAIRDLTSLQKLLQPLDSNIMKAYEVSSLVNSPKNNSVELIQKIC